MQFLLIINSSFQFFATNNANGVSSYHFGFFTLQEMDSMLSEHVMALHAGKKRYAIGPEKCGVFRTVAATVRWDTL